MIGGGTIESGNKTVTRRRLEAGRYEVGTKSIPVYAVFKG